jgi:hypothetical protein
MGWPSTATPRSKKVPAQIQLARKTRLPTVDVGPFSAFDYGCEYKMLPWETPEGKM